MDWFPNPHGFDPSDPDQRIVSHPVFGKVVLSKFNPLADDAGERLIMTMYLFPFGAPSA